MIDTREYLLLPCPPMSKSGSKAKIPLKRGGMISTPEYKRWQSAVRLWMASLRRPMITGPVRFDYVYIVPDARRRDDGNMTSGLEDCASGILIEDDSLIVERHGLKLLERPEKGAPKECRLYFRFSQLKGDDSEPT